MPTLSSIIAPNNIVTSDNELTLTNKTIDSPVITVNGQTGNPRQPLVFDDNGSVTFGNGDSFSIPAGGTAARPAAPATGELRYNTDTSGLEQYNGTSWVSVVPDDIDLNTLSINGTQVVDSSGNLTNIGQFNGYTPASESISISAGSGLTGGGDLSANRTISADIATSAEAITATSDTVLMTPAKTLESINENVPAGTTNAIAFFL